MRNARIKGVGRSYYHCMSRVVHRQFLMDDKEKEQFLRLMRRLEGFCDVRVLTYALMDNHFHILLEVPAREESIDDEELFRRMAFLYGPERIAALRRELERWRAVGREDLAERCKGRYLYRMHDVSEFMKTLKQRCTQGYNHRHGQSGTLWESRFKSVLVEDSQGALARMAAYIDLNPVRAGIVQDPKDYRYCGYGEAVSRGGRAADCIRHLAGLLDADCRSRRRALKTYRRHLYMDDRGRSFSPEEVNAVLSSGGELPLPQLLRCRVRYFSDSLVLGGRMFVDEVYQANRGMFGANRRSGPRPLRHGDWGGLCSLRDLRRAPITVSIG